MWHEESSYLGINDILNSVIFDGRFAGRPLYLDIEGEILTALSNALSIGEEDVAPAVSYAARKSLNLNVANPFSWHENRFRSWWLHDNSEAPPFTALLCALSIAAENMRADEVFSSINYYERLFETLRIDDKIEKARVRSGFRVTRRYWEALNRWLSEKEGALGRPTATQVISHWTYVSYPISQALVREADRERLRMMFDEFGLVPGESLSTAEMSNYLLQWIGGDGSGRWLKKLWSNPDLREKIAQTAALELEAWIGAKESAGDALQRKYVLLYGQVTGWPKQALRLALRVYKAGLEEGSALRVPRGSTDEGRATFFKMCQDSLVLSPSVDDDFLVLDPAPKISLSPALALGFQLEARDGSATIHRQGRPVIPMERAKDGVGFREVTRISLLGEHIVLCHNAWFGKVEAHLREYARDGFLCFPSGKLDGVPEDWGAFLRVEMLQVPNGEVHENLQCVTPLAETSLSIYGGLHLIQQDWHSLGGLEVMGALGSGTATLELVDTDLLNGNDTVIAEASAEGCVTLAIPSDKDELRGDYEIRLKKGTKPVQRRSVNFCNASKPRRKTAISAPELSYAPSSIIPAASLSAVEYQGPGGCLRGMSVEGVFDDCAPVGPAIQFGVDVPTGYHDYDDDAPRYIMDKLAGFTESCAVTGGHRCWICEPFEKGENPRRPMLMTCRDCGVRVLTKDRGRRKKGTKKRGVALASPKKRVYAEPAKDESFFGPDILFDAICYLGGGRASRLTKLASSIGQEPWAAQEFVRNLSALGHIDVELNEALSSPVRWWSAPPTIAQIEPGKGFLAGFRSSQLISEIEIRLKTVGAEVIRVELSRAPTAIFLEGANLDTLEDVLSGIADPYGRALRFVEEPAKAIARIVRPMGEIIAAQPATIALQLNDVERFDPPSGQWKAWSFASDPGAYRTAGFGRAYFVVDGKGSCFRTPYGLAKVFAANLEQLRLHAYDPSARTFIAALGCPPPGLLERALAACSGRTPISEQGKLKYDNVPEDVARMILERLYN